MLDITKVDEYYILRFGIIYNHAKVVFNGDPVKLNHKKIRQWICKQYVEFKDNLPHEIDIYNKEYTDLEVIEFIRDCHLYCEKMMSEKTKSYADLDDVKRYACSRLDNLSYFSIIHKDSEDVTIVLDDYDAFKSIATLKNVKGIPEHIENQYCYDVEVDYNKQQKSFMLSGKWDNVYDEENAFQIMFDDIEVKIDVFNVCKSTMYLETPWQYLMDMCYALAMKYHLVIDYCNDAEKALIPLIEEIITLGHMDYEFESNVVEFPLLKVLIKKLGYTKLEKLLQEIEQETKLDQQYVRLNIFVRTLCNKQYKPLFMEVFNLLEESQKEYSSKFDIVFDEYKSKNLRNCIHKIMEENGYIGEFPVYQKDTVLKGMRFIHSYDLSYSIWNERNVECYVYINEVVNENDNVWIQFMCGTALLKKNEDSVDIFDCMFDAKGKRYLRTVDMNLSIYHHEDYLMEMETVVNAAIKRAELDTLTKEERHIGYNDIDSDWKVFFGNFLLGILFSFLMCLVGVIFTVTICLVVDKTMLMEVLKEVPWMKAFIFMWFAYGISMGIVEVLANRRK